MILWAGDSRGRKTLRLLPPAATLNREGDCLAAKLRPGNVHSAEDWEELLIPEIERQQKFGKEVAFRAAAAFAKPVPRVGFIVTNLEMESRAVVRFYNKRGAPGQWTKEGK